MSRSYPFRLAVLALAILGLSGCALLPDEIDRTRDWSAQRLYSEAKANLEEGDYQSAIDLYEKLEARYPFGRLAQQSQLDIAYAYYKFSEPESALAALDRFIRLYPKHPNVDYAYYLRGLVNFNRGKGLVERYVPTDVSQRDPGVALQSFNDFSKLTRQFPDSKYVTDAAKRMQYLKNNLARHELHVADYYMRRGAYVAAANRAKYVIENYPKTPATSEALVVLVKAYRKLELDDLAADTMRVLELNYPDHPELAGLATD